MAIIGLTHAAIRVSDMDRALEFYCRGLGLREKFRLTRDDGSIWLVYLEAGPRQFVELFPGAAGPREDDAKAGPVHFCLEVDDIQQTYRDLKSRDVPLRGEPVLGGDGSWQIWTSDPDGTQIEFHQFTEQSRQTV